MQKVKRSTLGRPKSSAKQMQILEAASCLFLRNGFSNTSMDAVAKEAGVSKQTVYSHYKNKDALYSAVIDFKVHEYQLDEDHIRELGQDLDAVLHMIGGQFVQLLHDPEVIAMYRVVMGEVSTNPHVAELFFNAGPKQAMEMLVRYLMELPQLDVDPGQAMFCSMAFFNLLKGDHHMKNLMGIHCEMSPGQQARFVGNCVAAFKQILSPYCCESPSPMDIMSSAK